MNDPRQRAIEAWLDGGPEHGPDDGLTRALQAAFSGTQRPGWATTERWLSAMNITLPMRTVPVPRFAVLLAVLTAITVLVAVGILAAGTHKPILLPVGPARPGVIVFADSNAIWQADATGGAAHRIVTTSARLRSPTFSPDGTKVAYWQQVDQTHWLVKVFDVGSAATVTVSGGPVERHATAAPPIAWAPDGTRLAFGVAPASAKPYILVARLDGSPPVRLAGADGAIDPAWSPDGDQIASLAPGPNGKLALFVTPAAGGPARQISRTEIDANGTDDDFAAPSWSPDGTRLATHGLSAPNNTDILVVQADGSDERFAWRSNVPDSWPSWSPDGKELAFVSGGQGFPASIVVVTVDGEDWRTRTLLKASPAGSPVSWSPDGSQLLTEICEGTDCATQSLAIVDPLDVRAPVVIKATVGPSPQDPGYTASSWQRLAP